MNNKRSLASKFILSFVIVGVILCTMAVWFSYSGFVISMEQQYHDTAYLIADTVESTIMENVTVDELAEYVAAAKSGDKQKQEAAKNSEKYQKIQTELTALRKNMDLTDIYVTWYEPTVLRQFASGNDSLKPLLYVFDNYYKEEENFNIGDTSKMNKQNIELFAEVIETKTTQSKFIISDGEFGYNISALKPVLSKDGSEVICVIAVEEPMRRVQTAARDFVMRTVCLLIVAIILIIIFFVIYLYKRVVKPINIIADEVKRFGEANERNEESEKTLTSIKTNDEVELLAESIDKMEKDMLAYVDNITAITAEKERIGAELNVATKIQADMLPSIFPAFPERNDMDIFASMDPAKEVGGDFYDLFMVDDDHLAVVMADVSGKGVPAALFMVIAKTLIKNHLQNKEPVNEALINANNQLCEGNDEGYFVTTWAAVIDLKTGDVEFADAGHELPLVIHTDGSVEGFKPTKKRPPLATMEDLQFLLDRFNLAPGDKLFLYTDGVPEATNAENELYGMDRLKAVLEKNCKATPEEILVAVRADVDAFVGDAPQFDDLTMLAFERK
ncbi:MAG: PP2C family protein-serine/threonine phosphatase [Lachnospiraceae bacterium]|nr:PP2C family protein-serine/threonine phosphatase [Lachnospiraceae bacterium]